MQDPSNQLPQNYSGSSREECAGQTLGPRPKPLQFPNTVVLNEVGRRNTQMSTKERKCKYPQRIRKIRASIKIKSALPPPPPPPPQKGEFYGHGFSCRRNAFFQVSINWRTHFRPQNCGHEFYGHEDFSERSAKGCKRAQKGAKERTRALPRKNCKQPGLGTPKSFREGKDGNQQIKDHPRPPNKNGSYGF